MKKQNLVTAACVLTLLLVLSIASAQPNVLQSQALAQTAEQQAVGGDKCAAAWGVGLALAVASLSPCGVVCASLAWYDLLAIGAYCG